MTSRRLLFIGIFLLLAAGVAYAALEDTKTAPSCHYCGMDRAKYSHSRMVVDYDDNSSAGTCSIHCAAVDMALNIDKTPRAIKVGDYGTKELIDAEKAFWVIGGDAQGVMSSRAKWAFAKKEDADKFIAEHKGAAVTFEQAMKGAYEDMYADTKMIRDRRKAKKMSQMGH